MKHPPMTHPPMTHPPMKRVAIFGLGRSGLAAALGVRRLGGEAVVFDAKRREDLSKPEIADRADGEGIEVVYAWDGDLPEGFDAAVTNPALDRRHSALFAALEGGIEVMSEIELAYRIAKAPIVAITGTNGKSTTTVMTTLCLEAVGERAILCGNVFGSGYPETTLTEAALAAGPEDTLVAEISSFQLEWVSTFRPVAAAITNITPDHLDRYEGSFAAYAATKMRIFAAQTVEDYAVIRANDPQVRLGAPRQPPVPTVRTVGAFGEDSDYDEVFLRVLDRKIPVASLPFSEPHNIANAGMAAILADSLLRWRASRDPAGNAADRLREALEALRERVKARRSVYESGLSLPSEALPPEIEAGLKAFRGLAHRMERVGEKDGVLLVNNSMCTNPAAVVASVQALKRDAEILVGGANKGLDFAPLAQFLRAGRHRVYIYGRDAEEVNAMLGGAWPVFGTMDEAFQSAAEAVRSGGAILLAPGCASTDGYRDFRERGDRFRTLAKEWLEE